MKSATFGIIGYGRFGRLWAKQLSRFGKVLVYDKNPKIKISDKHISKTTLRQATRVDFLFLLVPISEIENCCRKIKNLLLSNTVIVDACSVKEWPARAIVKNLRKDQPFIATHPLFGPDSAKQNNGLSGLKIAVCPISAKKVELQRLLSILKTLGLKVLITTLKEHDEAMARSQALMHFIGRGLSSLKLKPQQVSTPGYKTVLSMNEMVVHDTWQLFLDMQRFNRFSEKIRRKFTDNLLKIQHKIRLGSKNIKNLRDSITEVDSRIINLIANRFDLAKNIGKLKKQQRQKIIDAKREKQLLSVHKSLSNKLKLDYKVVSSVFKLLMNNSKRIQNQ